jgi:hypothetical protein
MKKFRALILLLTASILFGFKGYLVNNKLKESENEQYNLVLVTYNVNEIVSEEQKILVRGFFETHIFGEFEQLKCIRLSSNQEIWSLENPTDPKDPQDVANNEPIKPELLKLLKAVNLEYNSPLLDCFEE